ncbi:UDP-2,3-diacylglucosamine diphosphatase [Phytohalomonas tamaricis]|uniref:UDP-2,3-diacylglucosamine diphosphatase n=1 Tax=Phytohalomonas tamaricis TaxID=2081032 RepID=UPI000D0B7780|nr:UDP-2,3-diacylglucosamine diphosphatase [Phytohalomonas tamaricis]
MTTLFISDLHLQPDTPALAQGFLDYLEYRAAGAETLYILGDLFESWIGDDAYGEFEAPILAAMKAYSDTGSKLYVMHGNRDFLLGDEFAKMTGATLIDDPAMIELGGIPILLMHGDSLCTQDTEYMKFRAMARDPQWQHQVLAMPVRERMALAAKLREQSGEANSRKAQDIMDVTPEEVENIMNQYHVHILIQGHTHRPDVHDFKLHDEAAKRYVIGDWHDDEGWEVRFDGLTLTLEHFSLSALPC